MNKNEMMANKELTKEVLRTMLETEYGILMSNNEFKKTKREQLIDELIFAMEAEEIDIEPVIKPVEEEIIVPVGDFSSDKYVVEEIPFVNVTTYHKIEISKKVKDACLNNKLKYAGINTADLKDIISEVVFNKKYYRYHTVKEVIGVARSGEVLYQSRKERVEGELDKAQQMIIQDVITKMVSQHCLTLNQKGNFYFLAAKLRNWNFK